MIPDDLSRELTRLMEDLGGDEPTVCLTHMRFIPCRRDDRCQHSSAHADVKRVRQHQQGDRT